MFPCTKKQLREQLRRSPCESKPEIDIQTLHHCEITRGKFTEELDRNLNPSGIEDVNELNELIVNTVKECAEKVCPAVNKVTKKEPWEDAELQKMIKDLRKVSKLDQIRKRQKAIK